MTAGRLPLTTGLAAVATVWAAGCSVGTSEPFLRQTFGFSFESGFDWAADGTDLDDPPVIWTVEASQELAERGTGSVKLALENLNDAGKIWMEHAFLLRPGATYDVKVAFDFASADFGDIGLWTIIAGVSPDDPETSEDLTFQDDTGNGAASDVGFLWTGKSYSFTETAGEDGLLYVALGVWGTSEFSRAYFIDDVALVFTRR